MTQDEMLRTIIKTLDNKKAESIKAIKITDLTILADEDGGNWTYFAFDANKLSPAQARQTALRIAADIRKGRT